MPFKINNEQQYKYESYQFDVETLLNVDKMLECTWTLLVTHGRPETPCLIFPPFLLKHSSIFAYGHFLLKSSFEPC